MSRIIPLCLGLIVLAFFLPKQVYSQASTSVNPNVTNSTMATPNSSVSRATSAPAVTSSMNTTIRGHADSLYASTTLFLSIVSMSLLHHCC
ncbi:hypothetical protein FKM82_010915 [Ascaphus truei]